MKLVNVFFQIIFVAEKKNISPFASHDIFFPPGFKSFKRRQENWKTGSHELAPPRLRRPKSETLT